MDFGEAVRHGFSNLTNFDGRDARSTFWWWVLVIVVINFLLSMFVGLFFTASAMSGALVSAASGGDEMQVQAEMMRNMADGLSTSAWVGVGISLLSLALLLASFVRRLRDAGLPVLIAAVPVVTTLWGAYESISIVGEMQALMANADLEGMNELGMSSWTSGLISYGGYLVVIICGVIPSKG